MAGKITHAVTEIERTLALEAKVQQLLDDVKRLWNRLGQLPQGQRGMPGLDPAVTPP